MFSCPTLFNVVSSGSRGVGGTRPSRTNTPRVVLNESAWPDPFILETSIGSCFQVLHATDATQDHSVEGSCCFASLAVPIPASVLAVRTAATQRRATQEMQNEIKQS